MGYQSTRTYVDMNQLLDEAEAAGVLDATQRRIAREIASEGDEVLHENPTTLSKAYEVLVQLRGVLLHIYDE